MDRNVQRSVDIPVGGSILQGDMAIPAKPKGVVLFAHGSGSSRHSSRNQYVAQQLRSAGLATLLMDLLTVREEAEDAMTGHLRFDIAFLAERLVWATDWLVMQSSTAGLPIGCFGASTGAAAALVAAGERPRLLAAIVSRGGRPDLAAEALHRVEAPTLLIVGGNDAPVIAMNRQALGRLRAESKLVIVHGATHLFEEPGALEEVARLATEWFTHYLDQRRRQVLKTASGHRT